MRGVAAALLVLALGACSKGSTRAQLLVVVDTDQAVPGAIDEVALMVLGPDGDVALERQLSLGTAVGQVGLPVSFGVAPIGGDVTRRVTVIAEGRLRGGLRVRTRARTSFAAERVVRLDLFLSKDCEDDYLRCEAMEQTCRKDGCAEVEIPIAALLDPRDASVPDAAAADAAPLDAAPLDAMAPDAPAPDAPAADATGPTDAPASDVLDAGPRPDADGGVTSQGAPCTFAGGGCAPDFSCVESKAAPPLCRKPCDDRMPFECSRMYGQGSTCVHYTETDAGSPKGYYCSVPCDPLAQRGCAATTACDMFPAYIEVPDVGSVLIAYSDCRAYGDAGQEEECASGLEIGRECAPGFDCYNTTCRALCAVPDGGPSTCPGNFTCGPLDPIGPDGGRPLGACFPN